MLVLADFLTLGVAGQVGCLMRDLQLDLGRVPLAGRAFPLVVFIGVHLLALSAAGAYAPEAVRSPGLTIARSFSACSLAAVGLALVYIAFPTAALPGMGSLFALPIGFAGLVGMRILFRRIGHARLFSRLVLVLGKGPRADRAVAVARASPAVAFLGQIDLAQLEDISSLAQEARRLGVSDVVLAPEERRRALPLAALLRLRTTGVRILELSTFIERETGRIDLAITNPSWLILSTGFTAARRASAMIKRMYDIASALLLLCLLWPVLIIAALAVWIDSPGGVIFRQIRVGRYGQNFELLKLRSMVMTASSEASWTELNDPRVTRVGKWIRLFRIDELPQLWNVLRGEMSLVGPRPEQPEFVATLETQLPFYAERHMVKPGITGWAQVNYPYGASLQDAQAKLEYDLYYAKNYSLFLDVEIVLKTIRVILSPAGAR